MDINKFLLSYYENLSIGEFLPQGIDIIHGVFLQYAIFRLVGWLSLAGAIFTIVLPYAYLLLFNKT